MHRFSRFGLLALTLLFAAWCVKSLHGDLASMSFAPLLRAWDLVVAAVVLSLLNYGVRVLRWRSYLAKLGHSFRLRFLAMTYVAGFAYTLSPGKVGEIVRARYYLPKGVRLAEVTASFFAERLLDIVAMLALATLLFTTAARFSFFLGVVALMVVAALACVSLLPWPAIETRLQASDRLPVRMRKGLITLVSMVVATRPLFGPAMLTWGFVAGLLAWGLEGTGLALLCGIYPHVQIPWLTAVGTYGIAVLVGGLSFLPGGLGSTEAAMTGLLVTQGFAVSEGLLITLTCRLVTLWLGVAVGWVAVLLLRNESLSPVEA